MMSILNDYEHIKLLGEGHFCLVKLYRHRKTGRMVAVKELKTPTPDHIARIKKEVEILEQLRGHSHIVELISYQLSEGKYLYLLPAAAKNLQDYISENNQNLNDQDRINLYDQILKGIQHAHCLGIIHRDINPNNVLIFQMEGEAIAKVSDFGLGKQIENDAGLTRSSVADYGTLYYVAPEQQARLKDADQRSDIYSLGRLLNFILKGRRPDSLHGTPFDPLIQKATAYDPEQRYQSLDDLINYCQQIKSVFFPEPGNNNDWVKVDGEIDWQIFHRFAATRYEGNNVYEDYLVKITEVLSQNHRPGAYSRAIGDQVQYFVTTFMDNIDKLPLTGYSFESLDTYGEILRDLFYAASDSKVKLLCFGGMMKIASDMDQWDVQKIVTRIMKNPTDYRGVENEIANILLNSKWKPDLGTLGNAPDVIKRACTALGNKEG